MKNKRAQSTLEYILVLTAIVGLIIFAAGNWIKPAVQEAFTDASTSISNVAGELSP